MPGPRHLSHEYAEMWRYCVLRGVFGECGDSVIIKTVGVPYIWSELLSPSLRTHGMIRAATMENNRVKGTKRSWWPKNNSPIGE